MASKTEEYKGFLQEQLKAGLCKAAAARAMQKKFKSRNLSYGYCKTLVYQAFTGKFNSNTKGSNKGKQKQSKVPTTTKQTAKKPSVVAGTKQKKGTVKAAVKKSSKVPSTTKKAGNTGRKRPTTVRKTVDGVETF